MTIEVGAKLPDAKLGLMRDGAPGGVQASDFFAGKKVALFGVPGAFTPTCSAKHLPGFKEKAADLKAKGVDAIACVSVNDVFVMNAWGKDQGVGEDVAMLADGEGQWSTAMGLETNIPGLGLRCRRFSLVADDGVVTQLNIEEPGEFKVSTAEHMLGQL